LVRTRIKLTGFRFFAGLNPIHIKFHYSGKQKKQKTHTHTHPKKKKKKRKKKNKEKGKRTKNEEKKINFDYFVLILHHLTNTHTTPDSKRTPKQTI
jgi:hypothetical protein